MLLPLLLHFAMLLLLHHFITPPLCDAAAPLLPRHDALSALLRDADMPAMLRRAEMFCA